MWCTHSHVDKHMLMSGTRSAGRTKSGSAMRSNAAVLSSNAGCTAPPPCISSSRLLLNQLCPFLDVTPNLSACIFLSETPVLVCADCRASFLLLSGGKKEKGRKASEIAHAIPQLVWGRRLSFLSKLNNNKYDVSKPGAFPINRLPAFVPLLHRQKLAFPGPQARRIHDQPLACFRPLASSPERPFLAPTGDKVAELF